MMNDKIANAIDNGKVEWQVHTMYNRWGLVTEDIREAVCLVSRGSVSRDIIEDKELDKRT